MTIPEIVNQIWRISNKQIETINHKKFIAKRQLEGYLRDRFNDCDYVLLFITLPDRKWTMLIDRWNQDKSSFDYYIPDTIEHEQIFIKHFNLPIDNYVNIC